MEIRLDPDKDSVENLRLVAKILDAKVTDRRQYSKGDAVTALNGVIKVLEANIGKIIPIDDIVVEMENKGFHVQKVEKALEKLKRCGDIFEPRVGFIQRL
jgi:DNA replicative helicase MCM subunit Mcm2 (Cdc46/Mcm family)